MNAMQPPQSVEEVKATLETTEKGGVRQSIRNCLTVFQRDPVLAGAIAYNILTDRKDIIKPIGFHRESTALTDTDMKYLLLYLEEMGFVFQQMYMLKNLTVYDNIILPAYQTAAGKTKEGRREINDRARELMQKLGISEIAQNDVNEVSGGQLQRACICRSMINKPKIIFADEPTGALNKQNSIEVMEELNRINSEGTSILLVTHDMKVAAKCERVLYIEDGDIRADISLGKRENAQEDRARERLLNEWLIKLGW